MKKNGEHDLAKATAEAVAEAVGEAVTIAVSSETSEHAAEFTIFSISLHFHFTGS